MVFDDDAAARFPVAVEAVVRDVSERLSQALRCVPAQASGRGRCCSRRRSHTSGQSEVNRRCGSRKHAVHHNNKVDSWNALHPVEKTGLPSGPRRRVVFAGLVATGGGGLEPSHRQHKSSCLSKSPFVKPSQEKVEPSEMVRPRCCVLLELKCSKGPREERTRPFCQMTVFKK